MPDHMVPEVPVTSGIENNGIGAEFYQVLLKNGRATTRRGDNFFDEYWGPG